MWSFTLHNEVHFFIFHAGNECSRLKMNCALNSLHKKFVRNFLALSARTVLSRYEGATKVLSH